MAALQRPCIHVMLNDGMPTTSGRGSSGGLRGATHANRGSVGTQLALHRLDPRPRAPPRRGLNAGVEVGGHGIQNLGREDDVHSSCMGAVSTIGSEDAAGLDALARWGILAQSILADVAESGVRNSERAGTSCGSAAGGGGAATACFSTTVAASAMSVSSAAPTGARRVLSSSSRSYLHGRRAHLLITRAANAEDGAIKVRSSSLDEEEEGSGSLAANKKDATQIQGQTPVSSSGGGDNADNSSPSSSLVPGPSASPSPPGNLGAVDATLADLALAEMDPTLAPPPLPRGQRISSAPAKGTDLLHFDDYLSPALAQKMARNGHLSAISPSSPLPFLPASPAAVAAAAASPASSATTNEGKKKLDAVLYSSETFNGEAPPVVHDFAYAEKPTPVFVMLPLDVVTRDGELQHVKALDVSLKTLKKMGVEGVMIDVWWGIVEREGPGTYDWTAYTQLLEMVRAAGLKLNAVMSFHACGANVGDYFEVKLPQWVLDAAKKDPDLFFTDQYGYRNPECVSLWADNAKTLEGRTPLECYRDFMTSFRDAVEDVGLTSTLSEISVGCGPCGELRYPSYPENKISPNSSQWQFPGIGEFQSYDQRALGNLARAGSKAGHIEWGGAGPHDAGGYNNLPHETGFFRAHCGSWDSEYGQFFLSWYAGALVEHGDRMLQCARGVFTPEGSNVQLAIKCAGVHWWYNSRSHAAELTAGYFNTRSGDNVPERDGYEPIVKICGKHGARLNFTCAEMRDIEHPFFSRCGPEGLLRQIRAAAARHGVKVAAENALCRFDQDAYDKIITNCRGEGNDNAMWETGALLPPMASFTFLRLTKELFEDDNFNSFVHFVGRMANETGVGMSKGERREVVEAGEVLDALLPAGNITSLKDIRGETSSGLTPASAST